LIGLARSAHDVPVIEIEVGLDDLTGIRFAADAVWETAASLAVLARPRQHALHRRLHSLVPERPRFDLDLLMEVLAAPVWYPDTLGPQPSTRPRHPCEQFAALRDTAPEVVERDLAELRRSLPGSRVAGMRPDQFLDELATAMTGYWRQVLEPLWDRVDGIVAADLAHHSNAAASAGLGAALHDLNDRLTYADGTLRMALSSDLRVSADGKGVWFVPSVFLWPWIAVTSVETAPVISYAARGAGLVWESARGRGAGEFLAPLLGRSRAAILADLDVPRTTTGLAARLRLTPGTVSGHLSVLTASGLLTSRRDGRRVLYSRTPMGSQLLDHA
jgi:DNA-binding transcriptional ArsR family regulator